MRPDFLIVGAMKCGTSTLAVQLGLQDGIFVTTPKEPNFFSDDDVYAKGLGWYESLFRDARPGDIKGEASTHYTKLPLHPRTIERMSGVLVAPKIIYIIRNPIQRLVSHYIHEWSLEKMKADIATELEAHPEMIDYGCYGMQIEPFVQTFGAENVLLTSLEAMKVDPQGELEAVCRFIGLETPPVWHPDAGAQNVSAERYRRLPMQRLLVENPVAAALRRTLIPKAWRERVRKARSMTARPEIPDALRHRLAEVFLEDRTRLGALFPGHPALDDAYAFGTTGR